MPKFGTLWQFLLWELAMSPERRERERENDAKYYGHLRFCLQPKGSARTPLGPKFKNTLQTKVLVSLQRIILRWFITQSTVTITLEQYFIWINKNQIFDDDNCFSLVNGDCVIFLSVFVSKHYYLSGRGNCKLKTVCWAKTGLLGKMFRNYIHHTVRYFLQESRDDKKSTFPSQQHHQCSQTSVHLPDTLAGSL